MFTSSLGLQKNAALKEKSVFFLGVINICGPGAMDLESKLLEDVLMSIVFPI